MTQGFVVWMTGLSGSGKTTLAKIVEADLRRLERPVEILDGDEIRAALSPDLGFSQRDREQHNRRVIFLAKILSRNGVAVIVPLISPFAAVRDEARAQLPAFAEVYVRASLESCIERDPKGLYRKALAGEIRDMTGMGSPYEPPASPDLVIDTERHAREACARQILAHLAARGWIRDEVPA